MDTFIILKNIAQFLLFLGMGISIYNLKRRVKTLERRKMFNHAIPFLASMTLKSVTGHGFLKSLEEQLQEAVDNEDYETAENLKKKIEDRDKKDKN